MTEKMHVTTSDSMEGRLIHAMLAVLSGTESGEAEISTDSRTYQLAVMSAVTFVTAVLAMGAQESEPEQAFQRMMNMFSDEMRESGKKADFYITQMRALRSGAIGDE